MGSKIGDGDAVWTIVDVANQIHAIATANSVEIGIAYLSGVGEADPVIVVGKAGSKLVATVEENVELWDVS